MNKFKRKNMHFKDTKGITLIALVITIIMLLILAGVSVASLSGQNGILTKATEAKTKTELAAIEEARALTQIEAATNTNGTTFTGTTTESGTSKEVKVKIPSGFAVSQVEGENSIDNGLVIIDSDGNEFVWIPCTESEYTLARDSSWKSKEYTGTADKGWTDSQTTSVGVESIRKLVAENYQPGFYIARYEAGIPENATEMYTNTDGAVYTKNEKKNVTLVIKNYKPVSKQNVQAWNFISQINSKIVAENMITNSTAKSYLVDSYAWNTVCRKINSKDSSKSLSDSTKWGNYYNNTTTEYNKLNTLFAVHSIVDGNWKYASIYQKGQVTGAPDISNKKCLELATGVSDDFKAYNVYDTAGNMWEWTTETSTSPSGYVVCRGGSFSDYGSGNPAVYSYGYHGVDDYNLYFGFRTVLYL